MKYSTVLFLAASLLAGCAADHGSILDNVGKRPNPPVQLSAQEAQDLASQAAALRRQADGIRAQLALEKDRLQRYRYYSELRHIDDRLNPIESRLLDAGLPAFARKPA